MEEDPKDIDEYIAGASAHQTNNSHNPRPWLWKKGQSGNPSGRPKGKSMKEYAKDYLASMTEDERQNFLDGLSKDVIWKMAEGNWQQDVTSGGEKIIPTPIIPLPNVIQPNNGNQQNNQP